MASEITSIIDTHGEPMSIQKADTSRRDFKETAYLAASKMSHSLSGWSPPWATPDRNSQEMRSVIDRVLDLIRNNGLAFGALETLVDNEVGTGLKLRALPNIDLLEWDRKKARKWARDVQSRFHDWANTTECDVARQQTFYTMTQNMSRSHKTHGEAFLLPFWMRERRYKTCFMFLDPDRVSDPGNAARPDRIVKGLELNRLGEVVAYWVSRTHPNDMVEMSALDSGKWDRIPARMRHGRKKMVHVFRPTSAHHHRGVPYFAPIVEDLKSANNYERLEIEAAAANAWIALVLKSDMERDDIVKIFGDGDTSEAKELDALEQMREMQMAYSAKVQGVSMMHLPLGTELQPVHPSRPPVAYDPYMKNIRSKQGAGIQLPNDMYTRNYNDTNYSGARAGMNEAAKAFLNKRDYIGTYGCSPMYALWFEEQVLNGTISAPHFYQNPTAYCGSKWPGPPRGYVDEEKEIKAAILRVANLQSTLEAELAKQGLDLEETLDQLEAEKDMLAARGLTMADVAAKLAKMTDSDNNPNDEKGNQKPDPQAHIDMGVTDTVFD